MNANPSVLSNVEMFKANDIRKLLNESITTNKIAKKEAESHCLQLYASRLQTEIDFALEILNQLSGE